MSVDLKKLLLAKNFKLLYVEDDENIRETMLRLLENIFIDITVAIDGKEGIEKFKTKQFDLIISDINMPHLSGLEMIEEIKKDSPDISVLMVSGYSDSEYFLKAIELDVDGFIIKPLAIKQFTSVLHKIIQRINLNKADENYKKYLEYEVEDKKAQIEHKLYFDDVTNLLNRYSFNCDIEKLKSPLTVLVDIDEFKVLNEVYGTQIGSKVLQEFAVFLNTIVDNKLCKTYRLSADEFAIVYNTYTSIEDTNIIINSLIKKSHDLKVTVDENLISIEITIGVSNVEKNSYESAKIALDYAKKQKKIFMIYSSKIDQREESSLLLSIKNKISKAIKDERVIAVYQPIVNKDGKTIKYETLMRLKEENSDYLIVPFHFLDIAIKTRLYESLSSIIIFKALHKLKQTDHTLSINFTYRDIKNNDFIQKIEEFFLTNESVGKRAVFEITESESIENYDDVKSFIARFRKYGVKIAIDDFGTGFSNFEYILEIKPEYLKIDGSLIKDIDTDSRAYTLVEAIVRFSHKLDIKIIAEYVHSEVIYNMLKELDIDQYQGFYFSEPLEYIENE